MSGRSPVISGVCDAEWLKSLWEVWMNGTHAHMKEAKRGVVDDIARDNKVLGILDFACDKTGDSVVVDPDLRGK